MTPETVVVDENTSDSYPKALVLATWPDGEVVVRIFETAELDVFIALLDFPSGKLVFGRRLGAVLAEISFMVGDPQRNVYHSPSTRLRAGTSGISYQQTDWTEKSLARMSWFVRAAAPVDEANRLLSDNRNFPNGSEKTSSEPGGLLFHPETWLLLGEPHPVWCDLTTFNAWAKSEFGHDV